jgi:hypothetical protein
MNEIRVLKLANLRKPGSSSAGGLPLNNPTSVLQKSILAVGWLCTSWMLTDSDEVVSGQTEAER